MADEKALKAPARSVYGGRSCASALGVGHSLIAPYRTGSMGMQFDMAMESIIGHSKSGSSMTSSSRSAQTPRSRQRQKLAMGVLRNPRSRAVGPARGPPVRRCQNTASRNRRLSRAGLPLLPGPPGKCGMQVFSNLVCNVVPTMYCCHFPHRSPFASSQQCTIIDSELTTLPRKNRQLS